MNSVGISLNISNGNIIKTNSFLHYIMTAIAKMWFKFKTNIFKIRIVTNITLFDKFVLLMSIPSEISIRSYYSIRIRCLQLAFYMLNSYKVSFRKTCG